MNAVLSFKVGDEVLWVPDGDVGVVVRVLDDRQAMAIRWGSDPRKDCWYSAWSGSLHNIERVYGNAQEAA